MVFLSFVLLSCDGDEEVKYEDCNSKVETVNSPADILARKGATLIYINQEGKHEELYLSTNYPSFELLVTGQITKTVCKQYLGENKTSFFGNEKFTEYDEYDLHLVKNK